MQDVVVNIDNKEILNEVNGKLIPKQFNDNWSNILSVVCPPIDSTLLHWLYDTINEA